MAIDPIEDLKEKLQRTKNLCQDLRIFINQSDQSGASAKISEIENSLDRVRRKMHEEFGWMLMNTEE